MPSTQGERIAKQLGPSTKFVLSEGDAKWVACAVDAEGTIGIWRQKHPKFVSGYKYRAIVQIVNTNFDFVAHARSLVDGYVTIDQHPKKVNPKHRVCYRAWVSQRAVLELLTQIQPFLIIKGRQAEFVMQFCRVVNSTLVSEGQDHEAYEQLYLECKALNKRGPLT